MTEQFNLKGKAKLADDEITVEEFARVTGYSVKHIYLKVRMGDIPAVKVRGVWRIKRGLAEQVK